MADEMTREDLIGYIQSAIPFLEEAWEACFHGQKERLLSAEERGMGTLLAQFRAIAEGERVISPGMIDRAEASRNTENAIAWAHRLLGDPNQPHEWIKRWCRAGDTAVDGLRRANARVEELEAITRQIGSLKQEQG